MSNRLMENGNQTKTKELIESEDSKDNERNTLLMNETKESDSELEVKNDLHKDVEKENKSEDEEWIDLLGSGAIMKKIMAEGISDTRPQRLEKCLINYSCFLEDDTLVEKCERFLIHLGDSDVISGLDVALGLMNVGEKCRLKIQPRLAFGKKGNPPSIPPDAVLIYDVELMSVEPEDEIENLTIHQRQSTGNKKRNRGNWWYSRGDFNLALQCYRRALDYLDEVEGGTTSLSEKKKNEVTDSDLQSFLEDRISVHNNMAAAQIKLQMYDAAYNSIQIVLRSQPDNVKAHYRKAKIYIGKNDMPSAMKWLQKAKELEPDDVEIQKEISNVARILEKQKVRERELARRMFNPPKNTDKTDSKKQAGRSKLGLWATLGATVLVGIVGIAAYRFRYT